MLIKCNLNLTIYRIIFKFDNLIKKNRQWICLILILEIQTTHKLKFINKEKKNMKQLTTHSKNQNMHKSQARKKGG